ncbi:MAG: apolipoprotein N-acyltransferase, partial [Desulfovibrio sp.]|nr:apolipoprotein N-acyltransferase [Desulfovibrio sp.]
LYIEGNIDQNQKWNPAFQEASLNKYVELTRKGAAYARENGADKLLVIWPETAMPFFFERAEKYARKVIRAAEETDAPLIFGAPGIAYKKGLPDEAVYNRAFLISPRGRVEGWYDKVHLVPFGEYLPRWLNFKFLDALLQGVGVYQEGESAEPLRYDSLALGMLICYEGVFPELARERVAAGANALVDISNDGWFRRSPAARQHLYLAAPRCIEQNRWLFRGTNNGFSATINNRGEVVTLGRQFEDGWLLSGGKLLKKRSVFYYIEPWEPFVAAFLLIIAASVRARSRKEEI